MILQEELINKNFKEKIKLEDYLLYNTDVFQLCVITQEGWGQCVAYIDLEDLMTISIPKKLLDMEVVSAKRDRWPILSQHPDGHCIKVPVLKIEVR